MRYLLISFVLLFGMLPVVEAQQTIRVHGFITDEQAESVAFVNVSMLNFNGGTASDINGKYELKVPLSDSLHLEFSAVGYEKKVVHRATNGQTEIRLDVSLKQSVEILGPATVEDKMIRKSGLTRLDPKITKYVVSTIGVESLIKSLPGTSSNNELSSQYNVRGGNFDENLVYVNGVQIYRPMLIRSGQQEGLSFINSDMVSSLIFSAGGFDATYGDKMSSVLDITYRKPRENAASFSASLLGGTMHLEGISKNRRFQYLMGTRYKTNRYLLKSLDTEGQYDPNFFDVQTYLNYLMTERWEVSFLGNYAQNTYRFFPETGETSFGTFNEAYKLKIYFDGQEKDTYSTGTGALSFNYQDLDSLSMRFILSGFFTEEKERFDILGQYYLNNLETNPGEEDYGDSVTNIGVGSFLDHANNQLSANVLSLSHSGRKDWSNQKIKWGGKYQIESIDYILKEWKMIDSAGYSLPYSDENVLLFFTDTSNLNLLSHRGEIYAQHEIDFVQDSNEFSLMTGIRGNYWSFNKQFLVSPRLALSYDPNSWRDVIFRLSGGIYHQPPFFKEMILPDGSVNEDIKAQSSAQAVLGGDYIFKAWDRPFKLMSEVYYKYLWNIIPYDIENVRIRYYGENMAVGYAVGFDLKVNGEFVKGTESWVSISVMQTKEDIEGDSYVDEDGNTVYPGYLRRPTDQRVNVNIFFQDYLPGNESWKAHLNMVYGSGLPFGPPNSPRYMDTGTIPAYRRVDLGLSKQIVGKNTSFPEKSPFRFIKDFWISLEAFNLLDINNTISHIWVSDISGRQYAVPNYLTGRRWNLKLYMAF
ncbi:MAG: carboxypeptidase-like regulatory domain-containing protein [Bacteroidales bacterium]|jgi:hypothetical protein|nr:carboxypeptidase-like regulatory domain-containing protein [Bacteroidales bacterium]